MPFSSVNLPGGDDLFRLLPVDDVQVIEVELGRADFDRRLPCWIPPVAISTL